MYILYFLDYNIYILLCCDKPHNLSALTILNSV